MISSNRKSSVVLVGLFMLPTSSKFHMQEPKRSGAFKEEQDAFLLQASDADGYPQAVVVTAGYGELDWQLGQQVDTQHAQVRKNLPPRFVKAILRADGTVEGDLPPRGLGLPHWSYIPANPDGSASLSAINAAAETLKSNRDLAKAEKEAVRAAKKAAPPAVTRPAGVNVVALKQEPAATTAEATVGWSDDSLGIDDVGHLSNDESDFSLDEASSS